MSKAFCLFSLWFCFLKKCFFLSWQRLFIIRNPPNSLGHQAGSNVTLVESESNVKNECVVTHDSLQSKRILANVYQITPGFSLQKLISEHDLYALGPNLSSSAASSATNCEVPDSKTITRYLQVQRGLKYWPQCLAFHTYWPRRWSYASLQIRRFRPLLIHACVWLHIWSAAESEPKTVWEKVDLIW